MPSSLRGVHSRAWVYSTHPPVSVCGTGGSGEGPRSFSGRLLPADPPRPVGLGVRRPHRPATAPFDRQPSNRKTRPFAVMDPSRCGIVDPLLPSLAPFGASLRPRLTLGGRTWPRNPWVYGGRDSHPAYRYSCLHPHLGRLHRGLPPGFSAGPTFPYRALGP